MEFKRKLTPKNLIVLWRIPVCLKNITIDPDHHPHQSSSLYSGFFSIQVVFYAAGYLKVQV